MTSLSAIFFMTSLAACHSLLSCGFQQVVGTAVETGRAFGRCERRCSRLERSIRHCEPRSEKHAILRHAGRRATGRDRARGIGEAVVRPDGRRQRRSRTARPGRPWPTQQAPRYRSWHDVQTWSRAAPTWSLRHGATVRARCARQRAAGSGLRTHRISAIASAGRNTACRSLRNRKPERRRQPAAPDRRSAVLLRRRARVRRDLRQRQPGLFLRTATPARHRPVAARST